MDIIILASLYIVPAFFIIGMLVFRNLLTLQVAGTITLILVVIPLIVKLPRFSRCFRQDSNQGILDLMNCFSRHKHKKIEKWFSNNFFCLNRFVNTSIIVIPILAAIAGALMLVLATFSNAR